MERYPEYTFMSSQPQLYDFVKRDCPALYERIRARVAQGRWEPEGGMWLEADCNMSSGESLVRQFLHGKRFFRDAFGRENRILWLPDAFGFSGALPQIMKQCGADYFMTLFNSTTVFLSMKLSEIRLYPMNFCLCEQKNLILEYHI